MLYLMHCPLGVHVMLSLCGTIDNGDKLYYGIFLLPT